MAILDLHGKPRWHDMWAGNPIIAQPNEIANGEVVQTIKSGPDCRPYIVYPFTKDTGWTFNKAFKCRDHVAKIHLTADEKRIGEQAKERYGPYVLIEPYTKHDNFRWPMERWQEVIGRCRDLTFVQHEHAESKPLASAHRISATFRQTCGLIAFADAYIRSESGLCHAAAAFGIPQVTLFGGCMDPEVMAGYPLQTVIADTGEGSPCGRWHPCKHCAACMDQITVDQVVKALRKHVGYRRANGARVNGRSQEAVGHLGQQPG